jgi:hypothetical protein
MGDQWVLQKQCEERDLACFWRHTIPRVSLATFLVADVRPSDNISSRSRELGSLRCGDLYPIMFGADDPGSGCGYVQFHNEPQVIR